MNRYAIVHNEELLTLRIGADKEVPRQDFRLARRAAKLWPKISAAMTTAAVEVLGPGFQVELLQDAGNGFDDKVLCRRMRRSSRKD